MVINEIDIPLSKEEEKYFDKVGAFEGGGYVEKGIYRPKYDCTMKSRSRNNFCPVCSNALKEMIKFHTDK